MDVDGWWNKSSKRIPGIDIHEEDSVTRETRSRSARSAIILIAGPS